MSTNGPRAGPAITKGGSGLPSRVIFHGVEGVGKSSFSAHAPKPIFGMTRGETGLLTLIDNGQVPATDHFEEFQTWPELLAAVRYLTENDLGNRTFVLDTLNGAERLCFEHVCKMRFKGEWEAFMAYGKGPEVSVGEWLQLFVAMDQLRVTRKMAILCLCHTRIKPFKNPEGEDYDRFSPELHDKMWGPAAKWADVILFGNFETFAKKERGAIKAKGVDAGNRLLYTRRCAAWDAKNRNGLPEEIPLGKSAAEGWSNFYSALKAARANTSRVTETPEPAQVETQS